jgi:CpeT protein
VNALKIIIVGTAILSCAGSSFRKVTKDVDLERLVIWMSGSFSSQMQAQADTNFFDIRLKMAPIWKERRDGFWLYVEQATASHTDKPYRQRVYHLSRVDDKTLKSDVFTLPEPLRFAGDWKKDKPLTTLTPDSLLFKEGCSIFLRNHGDSAFLSVAQPIKIVQASSEVQNMPPPKYG